MWKKFFEWLLINFSLIVSVIFLLLFVLGVFFGVFYYLDIDKKDQSMEVSLTYYILGIFTSLFLVFGAWRKINEANKNSKISYLLQIDERWGSEEIIRAREVIHQLYLDAMNLLPNQKTNKDLCDIVGQGIKDLHGNQEKIEHFISLLNLLDFWETIGYLYYCKAITILEIRELFGNSIVYYFVIYKPFIEFRREQTLDLKFYEHFENLYKAVKNYKMTFCERICNC
ncbi:DUF4760 domain-containing protein [Legionella pneumophila]|uniref:DUF4760 domain-containing protein n=1 Tax=Legionella pneumophila TaxID=446 RepID=UPI000D081574|nr:hypothetical protein [Legionella pneumophila]